MKVLLDVCTPRQVRDALHGHQVHTAAKMGWGELENGDLIREAEAVGFELLIVCDKNIRYQQNLDDRTLAILELWTNHRPTLEQHWPYIRGAAESISSGEYRALAAPWHATAQPPEKRNKGIVKFETERSASKHEFLMVVTKKEFR